MLKLVYNVRGDVLREEAVAFSIEPDADGLRILAYQSAKTPPVMVAYWRQMRLWMRDGAYAEPHRILELDDRGPVHIGFPAVDGPLATSDSGLYLAPSVIESGQVELRSSGGHLGVLYDPVNAQWYDLNGYRGRALYVYDPAFADERNSPTEPCLDLAALEGERTRPSALAD